MTLKPIYGITEKEIRKLIKLTELEMIEDKKSESAKLIHERDELIDKIKLRSYTSIQSRRDKVLVDFVNADDVLHAPNEIRIPLQKALEEAVWYFKKLDKSD
jgi:hypothetical protein